MVTLTSAWPTLAAAQGMILPPRAIASTSYDRSAKLAELLTKQINPWQEEAWVISLNSQLQCLQTHLAFRGTADHCPIHPRDVFRLLIQNNASFFAFAHNHPSGNHQPSREDLRMTERLVKAGRLMEIPLIDHIIFSNQGYYSFADHGRIKPLKN